VAVSQPRINPLGLALESIATTSDAGGAAKVARGVVCAAAHPGAVGRHGLDREPTERRVGDTAADSGHDQAGQNRGPSTADRHLAQYGLPHRTQS
jgi:hypothetical protein